MNNINFAIQEYVTGSDIKRVRKTLQLTQKKFAELLGVSKATMERWETKEDKITGPGCSIIKNIRKSSGVRYENTDSGQGIWFAYVVYA